MAPIMPPIMSPAISPETEAGPLVARLRAIVGAEAVLARSEELFVYECDGLTLEGCRPDAVVLPEDTEQVSQVVAACREFGRPFLARGAGTGLSGGAHPVPGCVIVECSRMRKILEVDPANRMAVVQPGVVNADLSAAVRAHGLF